MKFLMINGDLLQNKSISAAGKLIVSYVRYVESYNKSAWGSVSYVADVLGITQEEAEKEICMLSSQGILLIDANVIRVVVQQSKEKCWINSEKASQMANLPKKDEDVLFLNFKENALKKGHTIEDSDGERLFMRDEKGNSYILLKSQFRSE